MRTSLIFCLLICVFPLPSVAQEVAVLPGYNEAIEWLESIEWWGEDLRGQQTKVPRTLLIANPPKWREETPDMQVALKKEFFYRSVTSLSPADGLLRYSERGQEYVDEIKSMIRINHFDVADAATQRDEPLGFAFAVAGEEAAKKARALIKKQRKSGDFKETLARMRLE